MVSRPGMLASYLSLAIPASGHMVSIARARGSTVSGLLRHRPNIAGHTMKVWAILGVDSFEVTRDAIDGRRIGPVSLGQTHSAGTSTMRAA